MSCLGSFYSIVSLPHICVAASNLLQGLVTPVLYVRGQRLILDTPELIPLDTVQ